MTEIAAAAEAPEVVEAPVVVEAPAEGARTVSDIKRSARKRLTAKLEAGERARTPAGSPEGGQFTKREAEESPAEGSSSGTEDLDTIAASSLSGEVVAEATETEQAITPVSTSVTVPVADGHPLRQRGREAFEVAPEDERDLRALLNSHTRRAELDQVSQQLDAVGAQLRESRADADYWRTQASSGGILSTEQESTYKDILNTYGEADASIYRNGILATAGNEGLEQAKAEARQAHVQRAAVEKANQFAHDAINDAMRGNPNTKVPPQYPLWNEAEVRQALSGYGSICQARGETPTPNGWYTYANAAYGSKPEVAAKQNARAAEVREQELMAAKAKVTKEARQRETKSLEDAATRHATRPGVVRTTAGVRYAGTPAENREINKMTPSQQKRARRTRVRTWGQQSQ
jgi:hypothetical protein